jgi:SAM-dependent methyltransferase
MMNGDNIITAARQRVTSFVRACPLCGFQSGISLGEICFETFENAPFPGSFSLVICGECGFAFNDFASLQTDFNNYYENDNFYLTSGTMSVGGSIEHEEKRLENFAQRLAPYVPHQDARIIDVGSSRGGLLKFLSRRGFRRLYAVDPNPACVQHIKENLRFESAVGSAQALPFAGVRGDVLIYSHVIEHVLDLKAVVNVARQRLDDGGIICVEVPDASRYQEGSLLPFQGLYLEHVNHFDPQSLVNLFRGAGFETVSVELVNEKHSVRGDVPCVWAVFRKGAVRKPEKSDTIKNALLDYVSWSRRHPLMEKLRMLSLKRVPIYLWGMSHYAMLLLGQTPLRFCNLAGFVDKDTYKQNRKVMKIPIQSPGILTGKSQDDTVLITAVGYEDHVINELQHLGFVGRVLRLIEK